MMLHGEEDHLTLAHKIQYEKFIQHKLAQIVLLLEKPAQLFAQYPCLCRLDRAGQKRSAGQWEAAQGRYGIIKESSKKTAERCSGVGFKELFNG
jgi:hypothetical protein